MPLPAGDQQHQPPPPPVGAQVQLGAQPASTAPKCLILRVRDPPFRSSWEAGGGRRRRAGAPARRCRRRSGPASPAPHRRRRDDAPQPTTAQRRPAGASGRSGWRPSSRSHTAGQVAPGRAGAGQPHHRLHDLAVVVVGPPGRRPLRGQQRLKGCPLIIGQLRFGSGHARNLSTLEPPDRTLQTCPSHRTATDDSCPTSVQLLGHLRHTYISRTHTAQDPYVSPHDHALVITDDSHRRVLLSTRHRPRRAVRPWIGGGEVRCSRPLCGRHRGKATRDNERFRWSSVVGGDGGI
jgi:hypothetical protein